MKKLNSIIVVLLVISAAAVTSFAQEPAAAMLYEITGKNLTKPSYLLGTFHAICPGDMLPTDKLTAFVDKTDQTILELDLDDPVVMQTMAGSLTMAGGKSLKDFYTPEEYAKVDELLKNKLGFSAENVKTIMPSMLSVMVSVGAKSLGCTPAAVDMLVMQAAVAGKKPVYGLETVSSQIDVLNSVPLEKQARDLYTMALDPQKSINEIKAMMAVYKSQDSEKLFNITSEQMKTEPALMTKLLDDRNHAWIPKLESMMAEKPAFIAVGAGHLGGKMGVVNLLRAKGYKLKPIRL